VPARTDPNNSLICLILLYDEEKSKSRPKGEETLCFRRVGLTVIPPYEGGQDAILYDHVGLPQEKEECPAEKEKGCCTCNGSGGCCACECLKCKECSKREAPMRTRTTRSMLVY